MHIKGKKKTRCDKARAEGGGGKGSLHQASSFREGGIIPPACRGSEGSGTLPSKHAEFILTISYVERLRLDTTPGERAERQC